MSRKTMLIVATLVQALLLERVAAGGVDLGQAGQEHAEPCTATTWPGTSGTS